jgi:hypothetical protein
VNAKQGFREFQAARRTIQGYEVDLSNPDGYSGLRLPLRVVADKEARDIFFSVCS